MPSAIWDIIFKLAVQFGIPALIGKWPWIQKFLSEEVLKVIFEYIKSMSEHKETKKEIRARAIAKVKKCTGVACSPEIKK